MREGQNEHDVMQATGCRNRDNRDAIADLGVILSNALDALRAAQECLHEIRVREKIVRNRTANEGLDRELKYLSERRVDRARNTQQEEEADDRHVGSEA